MTPKNVKSPMLALSLLLCVAPVGCDAPSDAELRDDAFRTIPTSSCAFCSQWNGRTVRIGANYLVGGHLTELVSPGAGHDDELVRHQVPIQFADPSAYEWTVECDESNTYVWLRHRGDGGLLALHQAADGGYLVDVTDDELDANAGLIIHGSDPNDPQLHRIFVPSSERFIHASNDGLVRGSELREDDYQADAHFRFRLPWGRW